MSAQNDFRHEIEQEEWDRIASGAQFQRLLAAKKRFIIPAFAFFLVYYFLLPILIGYAPSLMRARIMGVSVAYMFALSQFLVGWVIAWLYLRAAARFDHLSAQIARQDCEPGGR